MFFCSQLVFGLVPALVLVAVSVIILWLTVRSHISRPRIMVGLVLILVMQTLTLIAWTQGWTAAAAFGQYHVTGEGRVFDPTIERYAMYVLYPAILVLVVLLIRVRHLHADNERITERRRKSLRRTARIAAVLEVFVLLCMLGNMTTFRRIGVRDRTVTGRSPDGSIAIQLVPMNCMIDVNGLVIYRRTGEFWWHPIEDIGDILTQCSSGSFEWFEGSRKVELKMDCGAGQTTIFEHRFDNR